VASGVVEEYTQNGVTMFRKAKNNNTNNNTTKDIFSQYNLRNIGGGKF
jgi:hypothetical protein